MKRKLLVAVPLLCLVALLGAGILHGVLSQNKTVITDGAARSVGASRPTTCAPMSSACTRTCCAVRPELWFGFRNRSQVSGFRFQVSGLVCPVGLRQVRFVSGHAFMRAEKRVKSSRL